CGTCRRNAQELPQHVPGYEVLAKLGQGGMGVVYLARPVKGGAAVALKLIIPESAGSERMVQMFLREVSVLSRLDHPRIVRFHEVGFHRGEFFFVMDYVDAVERSVVLEQAGWPGRVRVACGLVCQVADALAYAHARSF